MHISVFISAKNIKDIWNYSDEQDHQRQKDATQSETRTKLTPDETKQTQWQTKDEGTD